MGKFFWSAEVLTITEKYFKYPQRMINELLNMAADSPGSVFQISIKKCDHSTEQNLFVSVANRLSMLDIYQRYHGHVDLQVYDISVATEARKAGGNGTTTFQIQPSLTVGDLI